MNPQAKPAIPVRQVKLELRGAAHVLQSCDSHEVIISGPSETGKTVACLMRLHNLAATYPGAQLAIIRQTYKSAVSSVVQSFIRKVIPKGSGIVPYGGERPEWFDYPNGSRIWVGGMDNSDKILSSERDGIYVNQAEELPLGDWETLGTRATGRAGNMPFSFLMGDCNPSNPGHWILTRSAEGRLKLLESRHEDNPRLYDAKGVITEAGKQTMAVLDALTGVRRERLRLGRWVKAEGTVYEFDRAVHLIDRFDIPADWRRIRAIDFGFTNPFTCLWFAIDGDGRAYLYREIYKSGVVVADHAKRIKELSAGERIEASVSDHDSGDRAVLAQAGISTVAARKAVSEGIQAVQERLKVAGDGKPRLFIMRDSLVERDESLVASHRPASTLDEFDLYVWPKSQDGRPIKEEPVKENDHGLDALRYLVMYLRRPGWSRGAG